MSVFPHVNRSLTPTQHPPPIPTRRLTITTNLGTLWSPISSLQTPMILPPWTGIGLVASLLGLSPVLMDNPFKSLRRLLVLLRLLDTPRRPRPPGILPDIGIPVHKFRHLCQLRNT